MMRCEPRSLRVRRSVRNRDVCWCWRCGADCRSSWRCVGSAGPRRFEAFRFPATSSEGRLARHSPGPHKERGRGQVNAGFGCGEGLHVVLINGELRLIIGAVVAIEFSKGIEPIGRTENHSTDDAGGRTVAWTLYGCAPQHRRAARSSVQRARQVCDLMLNTVWKSAAVAYDE